MNKSTEYVNCIKRGWRVNGELGLNFRASQASDMNHTQPTAYSRSEKHKPIVWLKVQLKINFTADGTYEM